MVQQAKEFFDVFSLSETAFFTLKISYGCRRVREYF